MMRPPERRRRRRQQQGSNQCLCTGVRSVMVGYSGGGCGGFTTLLRMMTTSLLLLWMTVTMTNNRSRGRHHDTTIPFFFCEGFAIVTNHHPSISPTMTTWVGQQKQKQQQQHRLSRHSTMHQSSRSFPSSSSIRWSRRRNNNDRSYYVDHDDDNDDESDDYMDDDDCDDQQQQKQRRRGTYYDDDDDGDDDRDNSNDDGTTGRSNRRRENDEQSTSTVDNEDINVQEVNGNKPSLGAKTTTKKKKDSAGYYRVSFYDDVDPAETELDWEVCTDGTVDALVLLPPAAVDRPTAILHFVGGTFFGSAPKLWYRTFLEGLVRNTQTAIVITPIPITIFQSPLQHVTLAHKLQRALETAWYTVLEDEYGIDALRNIPLCGIGHSLGARLLTVLTTMNRNEPSRSSSLTSPQRRKQQRKQQQQDVLPSGIPPYKSMCLISFTNYGASAGIPGVGTLLRQSRRQQQQQQERTTASTGGDDGRRRRRPKQQQGSQRDSRRDWQWNGGYDDDDDDLYGGRKKRNRRSYDDDDDGEEEEEEEEWSEIIDELSRLVREQARRVTTALTPKVEDLELFPSPDQLWTAIRDDRRYAVNETLLVQFDDDLIDQSSKLAQVLYETNSSNVKFARLHGTHLTPVTAVGMDGSTMAGGGGGVAAAVANDRRRGGGIGEGWFDRASSTIWKAIRGRGRTIGEEAAMRDLRQSVVAYITDVVTK